MDLPTSLIRNIGSLCSFLTKDQIIQFSNRWTELYANKAGATFTPSQTNGKEPFIWVLETSLNTIIKEMNLANKIPSNGTLFKSLIKAWGNLVPWPSTSATLAKIAKKI